MRLGDFIELCLVDHLHGHLFACKDVTREFDDREMARSKSLFKIISKSIKSDELTNFNEGSMKEH